MDAKLAVSEQHTHTPVNSWTSHHHANGLLGETSQIRCTGAKSGRRLEAAGNAQAPMTTTEKKAKAIAKMRVAQLRPMARPRLSPNSAIHVSSRTLSLPAYKHTAG